jgi:hypothetical protein
LATIRLTYTSDGTNGLKPVLTGLPAGLTLASATLSLTGPDGAVTGTVDAANQFTYATNTVAKVKSGANYPGNLAMTFTNAPSATKAVTLTTPPPFVWPTSVKGFDKRGVAVTNWPTLVYGAGDNAFNLKIGSDTWNSNLTKGTVTIVESRKQAPDESGKLITLWGAVYYIPETKAYCISPKRAATGLAYQLDNRVGYTCLSEKPTYVVGVEDGFVVKGESQQGRCYLFTVTRGTEDAVCPV